jgi:diaminopimelate epimerase
MTIPFVKMQGLGNDFVVIDDLGKPPGFQQKLTPELARAICDRRFGVGADQILWITSPEEIEGDAELRPDARMDIFNADGSLAQMCGNGIRAVALYLDSRVSPRKPSYQIETVAGLKTCEILGDGRVAVEMGVPMLGGGFPGAVTGEALVVGGRTFSFFEVSMGNPHAVIFVQDVAGVALEELGRMIEVHPRFPERTNVEFVEIRDAQTIRVRVWERGAGATLACGTGACASAVAALATGKVQSPVTVELPGGNLVIRWDAAARAASVVMEGPAAEVFRGEYLEGQS